jgi:hypothetical protein
VSTTSLDFKLERRSVSKNEGKELDRQAQEAAASGDHVRAARLYIQASQAYNKRASKALTRAAIAMGIAAGAQIVNLLAHLLVN